MKNLWVLLFSLVAGNSLAQELSGKSFSTKNGAIDGYDPVAYFTDSKPVIGNKQFALK